MNDHDIVNFSKFLPNSTKKALFDPIADPLGRAIGAALCLCFQKPIKYQIIKKAEFDDLAIRATRYFSEVPPERRTDKKMGLLIKAIESSQYSLSESAMRELFAKLISRTIDKEFVDDITPYFSTILSNIGTNDARFLTLFKPNSDFSDALPIANIIAQNIPSPGEQISSEYIVLDDNLIPIFEKCEHNSTKIAIHRFRSEIDIFESFGIVEKTFTRTKKCHNSSFEKLEQMKLNFSKRNLSKFQKHNFKNPELEKGTIELTSLGKSFIRTVVF